MCEANVTKIVQELCSGYIVMEEKPKKFYKKILKTLKRLLSSNGNAELKTYNKDEEPDWIKDLEGLVVFITCRKLC